MTCTFHYAAAESGCWRHGIDHDGTTEWMGKTAEVAMRPLYPGDDACLRRLMRVAASIRGALVAQPRGRSFADQPATLVSMAVISHAAATAIAGIISSELPQLGYWEPDA